MFNAIQNALQSVAQSLPDLCDTMTHGDFRGRVMACSSRDVSVDDVTADAPQESRCYICSRADFPYLEKGSTVTIGESKHIVTTVRVDPCGASETFGVSKMLDAKIAQYVRSGTRIVQPIPVLVNESEVIDAYSDAIAPTTCCAWFVCVSSDDWLEDTEPQIGDELTFDLSRVRVASVAKHDGYFVLTCRARR